MIFFESFKQNIPPYNIQLKKKNTSFLLDVIFSQSGFLNVLFRFEF